MIRREGTWMNLEGWAMFMLDADSQWMKQLLTLDKVLYAPGEPGVPALKDFKLTIPVPALFLSAFLTQMSSEPPPLPHKYNHGGNYQFMSENPEFKGRGMNGRMITGQHMRGLRADIAELEKDLIGKTEAYHSSNQALEMEHRAKDVKNSAQAYLIDKELPKMYDAVFNENEMNGMPGFAVNTVLSPHPGRRVRAGVRRERRSCVHEHHREALERQRGRTEGRSDVPHQPQPERHPLLPSVQLGSLAGDSG
jgi:hypothetical protein